MGKRDGRACIVTFIHVMTFMYNSREHVRIYILTDKASIGGTAGAASGIGGTGHGGITLTMVIAPEER